MGKTLNRRTLLRGAGSAIALPFLDIMRPTESALACMTGGRQPDVHRIAFFYCPNGMHMPHWTPQGGGGPLELSPTLQSLAPWQDKINVISGLTLDGARAHGDGPGDHARAVASYLTGAHPHKTDGAGIRNGISIDQLLVQSTSAGQARIPSLELGMEASAPAGRCDSGYSCVYTSNISWRSPTAPVAKEINPASLFDRLFGDPEERRNSELAERRRKHRKSVLDAVTGQARQLHAALGSDDRRKLDQYLDSVRDIENRLTRTDALDQPELDMSDYTRPAGVPRVWADHMNLLFDVMTLAWQTDSTRIMTFMVGNAGSNRSYRDIGISHGHHDLSHHGNDADKQQDIASINRFHVELFSGFVKRLAETADGDAGNLLDNSLLVFGSGIADGNRHAHDGLPVLTIGNAGNRYKTGQHIRCQEETPLTNLYQTVLRSNGLSGVSIGDSNGIIPELMARQ